MNTATTREIRRIRKELNRLLEYPQTDPVRNSIRMARVMLKNALSLASHGTEHADEPHHD